jgi:hypothetical protein
VALEGNGPIMKIGFLLCAYNQEEHIFNVLNPLVKFAKENGHLISAVSVPFKEYQGMGIERDSTTDILKERLLWRDIDYLIDEPQFISEAEARTLALKPLLEEKCDYIILADGDEYYQYEDFNKIVNFIARNEFITWFSIPLKNYVGNGYLEEPFCPPRIFKTEYQGYKLDRFYHDNEVVYLGMDSERTHEQFAKKQIPQDLVFIPHFCWQNNEKSRQKINYQTIRWGKDFCSYKWEDGQVKFNEDYYKKMGLRIPKLICD